VHWLYLSEFQVVIFGDLPTTMSTEEFKDAYPDAKLYSQEEVVKVKADKSLKFDGGKYLRFYHSSKLFDRSVFSMGGRRRTYFVCRWRDPSMVSGDHVVLD
jgi:hypothetical protein